MSDNTGAIQGTSGRHVTAGEGAVSFAASTAAKFMTQAALQFAIRGPHRPKVPLISPVKADLRCEFWPYFFFIEVGHFSA